ncbi:transcriptional regulator with XRE-family HTH domain [Ancylobacter sp. 3268]|uniref:helix-turn-helix domain-containing protein n=1 Tax=Ancylobacter sp. 3268 TaxID=2817752 RepID=UPI0028562BF8|nr:helix-turn-helix transcriptional regulator [Ancylobacter sp. 3268]MDR6952639.1 transcriptional regulator with XRE-family HTH domain [Ancylobacter sp. 3268]
MSFGARLEEFRESLGMTQEQMAEATSTSLRTYSRYVSDASTPNVAYLERLIALGCDVSWLLTGSGEMRRRTDPWARFTPDAELMGRITEVIAKTYREANIPLSMVDLGRLSAEKFNEIYAATEDVEERHVMVKLVGSQLRKDLLTAEPGSGKRSA